MPGQGTMGTESVLRILKLISAGSPLPEVLNVIARMIESQSEGIACTIWLPEADGKHLYCAAAPSLSGFITQVGRTVVGPFGACCGTAIYRREPVFVADILEDPKWNDYRHKMVSFGTRSVWSRPLFSSAGKALGTFAVLSREVRNPNQADLELIENASDITAIAIERHLNDEAQRREHEKEAKRRRYLEEELRAEFGTIVGDSRALKASLNLVSVVAPTDSSVLLGDERGAFTGAVAQKTGRFELADKGTLFLDEVGDIPPELQAKLLRVLQEQEFERLGSNRTHKVDVRLIAATHRDLADMVKQGTFREDLYYRLKVFPVSVPALRQRAEDIPKLVWHFTALHGQKMNKRIDEIPTDVMDALGRYRWPGNVRELQNFIERAVILSPLSVLRAPIGELEQQSAARKGVVLPMGGLAQVERDHILRVLEASDWVVGGRNGAAERLGMKRTSLVYRMRKLRISRPATGQSKACGGFGDD